MSSYRTKVKIRTVAWGLGLQFLFAIIILREGVLSFLGMTILAALLSVYLLSAGSASLAGSAAFVGAGLVGLAMAGLLFSYLLPSLLPWALAAVLIAMIVNGWFKIAPRAQSLLSSGLITLGAAWLISRGISGKEIFQVASDKVAAFLSLSDFGARFLFGNLVENQYFFPGVDTWPGFGFQFALKVLPTIIFFGGFMAVLYHLGIMQVVIENLSRFMRWTIGTSGAETLSCSANIFVGQTEAPLLIKPFLSAMTVSELSTIMVGGFATIAGGVLAGYISMGVDAGHLIAASVMSAPAALVIGKIILPETEHSQTAGDVEMPKIDSGDNLIEAATNGITDGLKLAVNVGAMLLGFIALIAVLDVFLNWADSIIDGRLMVALASRVHMPFEVGQQVDYLAVGMSPATAEFTGIFPGSLQTLFGTVLKPLAWLMGVPWHDAAQVGNLLGVKLSLNEFVAFGTLGSYIHQGVLSERAAIISTYALCGFA
ncbi:MAG: hypothetical protein KDD47_12735, partial [Acidobacteria bacterium]|nr:hypothetical protein [Acidobacteriota bacterium]